MWMSTRGASGLTEVACYRHYIRTYRGFFMTFREGLGTSRSRCGNVFEDYELGRRGCGGCQMHLTEMCWVSTLRLVELSPNISLNAVVNLGYADGRFLAPVFSG